MSSSQSKKSGTALIALALFVLCLIGFITSLSVGNILQSVWLLLFSIGFLICAGMTERFQRFLGRKSLNISKWIPRATLTILLILPVLMVSNSRNQTRASKVSTPPLQSEIPQSNQTDISSEVATPEVNKSDETSVLLAKLDRNTDIESYDTLLSDLELQCLENREKLADMAVAYNQSQVKYKKNSLKLYAVLTQLSTSLGADGIKKDCKSALLVMPQSR